MKNKSLFAGILGIAPVFGLLLAGCGNPAGDDNSAPVNPPVTKAVTVYMQKPADWAGVYAYVWDDSGKEYSEGEPGTLLTSQNGGYYSFKADSAEYGYINVRFSDGGSQSAMDILGVDSNTWYQSAGAFSGDRSKVVLRAGETSAVAAVPAFKASAVTDSTVTLAWDPIPGIDGYILYDEFVDFDDNGEEIPNSEFWHFQKAFVPSERSLLDDNYGEYLDPEAAYKWKLVAVKYKDGANLNSLDSKDPDYINEVDYAPLYHTVYEFGELEVETLESSLAAPANVRVDSTSATSVELSWNAVDKADYYMVWWWNDGSDGREEDWYYIEEAYDTHYVDDNEEFIFPDSTYKYMIVAHNKQTYSKDSSAVTAATSSTRASVSLGDGNIGRAAAVTPSAPSSVGAAPKAGAANTIEVAWYAANNATKYEVALFTSASAGTPKSGTTKTVSGSFYGKVSYTYTSVPASPGVYYAGVRSVNGSKKSPWTMCSYSVSPFPKVSVQSAVPKTSGNTKTITVKMNASWKAGASYGYKVTVAYQDTGYTVSGWNEKRFNNTNTLSITGLDKNYKYKVYITPFASDSFDGATLIKERL